MESPKSQRSPKVDAQDNSQIPFNQEVIESHNGVISQERNESELIQQVSELQKSVSGIFLQASKNKITPQHIFNQLRLNTDDFERKGDNQRLLEQLIMECQSQDQKELQRQQVDKIIAEWGKSKKSPKKEDKKKAQLRDHNLDNEFPHQKITPSWVLENQGRENIESIIEEQFVERMFEYDINQIHVGDQINSTTDYEMIHSGGQLYYAIKQYDQVEETLQLGLYSPSRARDDNFAHLTSFNSESVFPNNIKISSSLVSFQQCGEYIYYFQIGEPASDISSIRETEITDVSQKDHSNVFQTPSKRRSTISAVGVEKQNSGVSHGGTPTKQLVKTNLRLIRYHIPSCYKEICHVYDCPDKFSENGSQLTPMSVIFIKDQASISGQTLQNWPANVDGSNCQKFLDSMMVAVLYHEHQEMNYHMSIRSLNPKKFSKEELFFSPKSFPLTSRLDILIAKKAKNQDLPCNQVVLVYVDNRGQYAFSTESMLCITSGSHQGFGPGGEIGMYVSKLTNLKAFGGGNSKLCEYFHKVAYDNLSFPKNCIEIIEENGNILKVLNQKSLSKVCPLLSKLIKMDSQSKLSTKFKALYDIAQETLIITYIDKQYIFSKGMVSLDKTDLLTHSQHLNHHGFIPPHVKAIFHDRDVSFDEGFVQLSYQFLNLARDQHRVYFIDNNDAFDKGSNNYVKLEDREHQFSFLSNPVIQQGKKKGDYTLFDSYQSHFSCPKEILQKYQIYFCEEKQKLAIQKGRLGDLDEVNCQIKTESLIFQEDDRNERPLVAINGNKGIFIALLDFKQEKILEQMKIYLNKGDQGQVNYNTISLSASSDIRCHKNNEFEQMFEVCMQIGDFQMNIYVFKVTWTLQWMGGFKVSLGMVGERRLYFKESHILKFFGPFFKTGYEINGSQMIFENDDRVRILSLPEITNCQYKNKFGISGCQSQKQFWIGYIKYSDEIIKSSGMKHLEMMKVGDHVIDGLLKTTPFTIKSYFLKQDWVEGPNFFQNLEILNGYSPAMFSLEDQRNFEDKLKTRFQKQQIDFGPFGTEKYDPLFQRSIHLTTYLEFTHKYQKTQDKILQAMFKNQVDLNDPVNSVLVENIVLVFHSKLGQTPKGELDLAPLTFKCKVNKFTGDFPFESLNEYSLAKSVYKVNLENVFSDQTYMPMIIIDKQWNKATRYYCWFNIFLYIFGYFLPLINQFYADSLEDDEGKSPVFALFVALYFVLVAANGLLKLNFRQIYVLDALMFTTFYFYYLKRFARSFSCEAPDQPEIPEQVETQEVEPQETQNLLVNLASETCSYFQYYQDIQEDDMFNPLGFRALKSYLILHCMIKLASLFRIIDNFRIIIDSVYIASIGLIPIGLMIVLATVVITQIDILYIDNKSFQELLTDLIQRWWTISPLFDSSQKSYLYISIYYFGELVLPVILVNMIIAVIFERYDCAVSKNNQLKYEARSAMNLEFYSILQPKLIFYPLQKLDLTVDQRALSNDHTDVQGIAQSVKSYIHSENEHTRQTLKYLTEKIEAIEERMKQGMTEQIPGLEKKMTVKSNQMAHDIKKLEESVKKLMKEESKQEDAPRSSLFGFMGGSTRKPNHQSTRQAKESDQQRNRNATPMRMGERENRFV